MEKPRLVGLNHIALEVGNIEEALEFYGKIFTIHLRGRIPKGAFIDMGDQFIALMEGHVSNNDGHRHFGLVVDDDQSIRELASAAGATLLDDHSCDFRDPWGNFVQVVPYSNVQFMKAEPVLQGMNLKLEKNEKPIKELAEKGIHLDGHVVGTQVAAEGSV